MSARPLIAGAARRTLGICLLLTVVLLWTASNFLASTILADNTYSKPFFVTYVNTSMFVLPLLTVLLGRLWRLWRLNNLRRAASWRSLLKQLDSHEATPERPEGGDVLGVPVFEEDEIRGDGSRDLAWPNNRSGAVGGSHVGRSSSSSSSGKLGLKETAKLSLEFCLLWFVANYFALACLQHTTVGSTTILTSTSGVWTLILGATIGVEKFTARKSAGVIASLAGIILISRLDLSTSFPGDDGGGGSHGSFPHKPATETALGDAMAAFSAIMYGVYAIVMKKQVGDESRVNMSVFFGLVGLFNFFLLWPGFVVLHMTGVERFSLPDSQRIWTIILINAFISLLSDICWAYAMLLTTPLVVTVGLSLTIPVSLVGQIILQSNYASPLYWFGAAVVFFSFILVNHESRDGTSENAGLASSVSTC